jgi:hypothetical protein
VNIEKRYGSNTSNIEKREERYQQPTSARRQVKIEKREKRDIVAMQVI